MKKKKKKLSFILLAGTVVFAILLSTFIGVVGYRIYRRGMMNKYQTYISGILNLCSENIDGDDLEKCISTLTKSGEYDKTQEFLNMVKNNYDFEYIYIVVPQNESDYDNMMYVMAGVSDSEKIDDDNVSLGDMTADEYSHDVVEQYFEYMKNGSGQISYYANNTEFGYMYTGSVPVVNSAGKTIAVMSVDITMDEVYETMKEYISYVAGLSIVQTVFYLLLLNMWLNRRVIRPLSKVEEASMKFAYSNKDAESPEQLVIDDPGIHTGDEIQSLSDAYVQMAKELKNYMVNLVSVTKEKERIGAELQVATQIQANMLPCIFPAFPERRELDIYATMNPAKEVGGDFYDLFMVDESHLAIVVADVSGKGVPAALFMVIGKTLLKDHTLSGVPLGQVFTEVNDLLCETNKEGLFITAFEAILDLKTGELEYVNAGHELPFICRKDESFSYIKIKAGFVLAGIEGMKYKSTSMQMNPGDRIFQYTDGVTEAVNNKNEMYGMERLEAVLNANKDENLKDMLHNVRKDIDSFVEEVPQFDDITMLCLEYKEKQED